MPQLGADLSIGDDLTVNGGVIELKNTGSQSELRMYCESSNHFQTLKHLHIQLFLAILH